MTNEATFFCFNTDLKKLIKKNAQIELHISCELIYCVDDKADVDRNSDLIHI